MTVGYSTSDGSATAGKDYSASSGTLTFAPGVTSQTFTVAIIPDLLAEGDETVLLTLSSPSGAILGTQATATLNIWDCPPILAVTPASSSICAGALPTAVHQTAINVSLTDGARPFVGIPLILSTSAGSLGAATGTTDSSGTFSTILTSNQWASGTSSPYNATVSVVADGVLTQTAQVTFNPPARTLSADVTTIPPGGVATLTLTLKFQSQFVAGHQLQSFSAHSLFGKKESLIGIWVLDGEIPMYEARYKLDKKGMIVNINPKYPDDISDFPRSTWFSRLKVEGEPEKGLKRSVIANIPNFGELTKVEYENQEFKTFLMFQSKRDGLTTYTIPITVYSNWKMGGTVDWDPKQNIYNGTGFAQTPGKEIAPTAFEPEWSERAQLSERMTP